MPIKHRIRNSTSHVEKQGAFIKGKAPHREHNAHKVQRKWPYFRAALIWVSSLGVLFLALATIGFGAWQKEKTPILIGIALVFLWLLLKLLFFLASKATTCPLCRANHFTNSKSSKHKNAYKIFPLTYATTAVITAVFRRCVRCMHCGVTFDLNKKYR